MYNYSILNIIVSTLLKEGSFIKINPKEKIVNRTQSDLIQVVAETKKVLKLRLLIEGDRNLKFQILVIYVK